MSAPQESDGAEPARSTATLGRRSKFDMTLMGLAIAGTWAVAFALFSIKADVARIDSGKVSHRDFLLWTVKASSENPPGTPFRLPLYLPPEERREEQNR